jgi:hypothetical protein
MRWILFLLLGCLAVSATACFESDGEKLDGQRIGDFKIVANTKQEACVEAVDEWYSGCVSDCPEGIWNEKAQMCRDRCVTKRLRKLETCH